MVRITVELVRKHAEHHDRCLGPLEEIALHQENIEKIEYLQDWCPKLQILLLQSNLIAKIENLNKLKHLNYLNLALNNIELIENLERCESLEKLDLTLNFIGKITSIETLKGNYNLRRLYLTGNPCSDYENYRDFVIGTLQQLDHLDGKDIERSEKIVALQNLPFIRSDIVFEENVYKGQRAKQKERLERKVAERLKNIDETLDNEELLKQYWEEKCENAPEVRVEMEMIKELKQKKLDNSTKKQEKREKVFFRPDGKAFNMNEPKIKFHFDDSDPSKYSLTLEVYKYLETNLVDADVNPEYVRVKIKGKIFQMSLPEEVDVSKSTAKRSEITGHLMITMPRLKYVGANKIIDFGEQESFHYNKISYDTATGYNNNKREYLEIGSNKERALDIILMNTHMPDKFQRKVVRPKEPPQDFVDNPDVPPLI